MGESEHESEEHGPWPFRQGPEEGEGRREECRERHLGQAHGREAQRPRRAREHEAGAEHGGPGGPGESACEHRRGEGRQDEGEQRGCDRRVRMSSEDRERERIERGDERLPGEERPRWAGHRAGGRGMHERRDQSPGLEPSAAGQCILGRIEVESRGVR